MISATDLAGPPETQGPPKHAFIDALRAYAVLAVILVHSAGTVPATSPVLLQLMRLGVHGTTLFFIVSAWTLSASWQARNALEAEPVRHFFIRRLFRVAPMFYVAIALYLLLDGLSPRYWAPNGLQWWQIGLTLLFAHGLHPEAFNAVVPGGWSIAVEAIFYLCLPWLARRVATPRQAAVLLAASLAVCALGTMLLQSVMQPCVDAGAGAGVSADCYLASTFLHRNFIAQLPVFAIGMLMYQLHQRHGGVRDAVALSALSGLLACMLALLFALRGLLPSGSAMAMILSQHIVPAIMLAIGAFALARWPNRLLVHRALRQLGRWSFSMFLLHFALLEVLSRAGVDRWLGAGDVSSILFYLGVVAITALFSWATYRAVERPGIALGQRLIAGMQSRYP